MYVHNNKHAFHRTNRLENTLWYDHARILGINAKRRPWPLRGRPYGWLGYSTLDRITVAANHRCEFFVGWHEITHASLKGRTCESRSWALHYTRYTVAEEEFADCVAELACLKWGYPCMDRNEWRVREVAMAHAKHLFENLCKELA